MAKLSAREIDEGFEVAGEIPCEAELNEIELTPHEAAVESLRGDIELENMFFGTDMVCNDHGRVHGQAGCSDCRNKMRYEEDMLDRLSKVFRFDVGVFNYGDLEHMDRMLAWLETNGSAWNEDDVDPRGLDPKKLDHWYKNEEHRSVQEFKSFLKQKGLMMKFDSIEIDQKNLRRSNIVCANTAFEVKQILGAWLELINEREAAEMRQAAELQLRQREAETVMPAIY